MIWLQLSANQIDRFLTELTPWGCMIPVLTARCVTCTLPEATRSSDKTNTRRVEAIVSLCILLISSSSVISFVNIFTMWFIYWHALTCKTFGGIREYLATRICRLILSPLSWKIDIIGHRIFTQPCYDICNHCDTEAIQRWYCPLNTCYSQYFIFIFLEYSVHFKTDMECLYRFVLGICIVYRSKMQSFSFLEDKLCRHHLQNVMVIFDNNQEQLPRALKHFEAFV